LRFDAVYSQAEVYVNGKKCGGHVGGATAFTVDATEAARPGARNLVALVVREYTDASILDYMSWYAHMPLAGIWRQSRIACTPWVHLGRLHVETRFDAAYVDAQLSIEAEVANAGGAPVQGVSVEW